MIALPLTLTLCVVVIAIGMIGEWWSGREKEEDNDVENRDVDERSMGSVDDGVGED